MDTSPPSGIGLVPEQLRQHIAQSRIFWCCVTQHYLSDPHCQAQVAYARSLGKPFVVARHPGCRIPEGWLYGVTSLHVYEWTSREELFDGLSQYLEQEGRGE